MQPSVSLICLESKTTGRSLQLHLLLLNVLAASQFGKHIRYTDLHDPHINPLWHHFTVVTNVQEISCSTQHQHDATPVKTNQHTSPVCLFCLCFLCPYIVWICAWNEYDKTGLAGADGTDWVWKLGTRKCTYIAIAIRYLVAVSDLICKFIQWK